MATDGTVDTHIRALSESFEVIMDAVKAGAERNHRVSSAFLTEAQLSQRELFELGRAFAAHPTELRGMNSLLGESAQRGRARAREVARQMLDELAQSRTEAIDVFARIAAQQRIADDATVRLARDAFHGVIDRAQARLERAAGQGQQAAPDGGRDRGDGSRQTSRVSQPESTAPGAIAATQPEDAAPPEWLSSPAAPTLDANENAENRKSQGETQRADALAHESQV